MTQAGATLGEYLNINTYIAKIPSSSVASVRALPFVTYVGDYQPAYKVSPRIGLTEIPIDEAFDPATGDAKPWVFEVVLHKGAYVLEVLNDLARIGIFPTEADIVSSDALTVVLVSTSPDAVPAMAQVPGVKWIAEKSYPKLEASSTNPATIPMVLQNNGTYTTNKALGWKLWNANIDGTVTNQIVTMMDSGLNSKLFHFSQDTVNHGTFGPAHRKIVGYDAYGSGDQCVLDNASGDGGHGAKTSQHAVGSISNMTSNPDVTHTPNENWDNGIAPGAKVYFQDIGTPAGSIGPPLDLGPSITAAIVKGSFVQNHSWGAATNNYDTQASNLDTAMFNNQDMVVTVSAGNRGAQGIRTLGSPSTAKNAICVGGNDVSTPNGLFIDCNFNAPATCGTEDLGSSRGPVTGANRTKPDIMAFIFASGAVGGEQMAYGAPTAMCQSDPTKTPYFNYTNFGNEGGTSFAAPEVAGLAALVRDYFQQGFYPSGTATPGNALTPRGSLVKAVLLASGEDMNATSTPTSFAIGKRYSSDVGYGRVNVPGVLHIGAGAPFLWVQNGDSLGQSATKSFSYNINGNAIPLRVMMVYYDQAGDALQKDADLRVTVTSRLDRLLGQQLLRRLEHLGHDHARPHQQHRGRLPRQRSRTARVGDGPGGGHRLQQSRRHELLSRRFRQRGLHDRSAGVDRPRCLHLQRDGQHHRERRARILAGFGHGRQQERRGDDHRHGDCELPRRLRCLQLQPPDRKRHHRGRRRFPHRDLRRRAPGVGVDHLPGGCR